MFVFLIVLLLISLAVNFIQRQDVRSAREESEEWELYAERSDRQAADLVTLNGRYERRFGLLDDPSPKIRQFGEIVVNVDEVQKALEQTPPPTTL